MSDQTGKKQKADLENTIIDIGWALMQLHGIGSKQYSGAWLDRRLDALSSIAKKLKVPDAILVLNNMRERPRAVKSRKPRRYCILDCKIWDTCKIPGRNAFIAAMPPKTKKELQTIRQNPNVCNKYKPKLFIEEKTISYRAKQNKSSC